MKAIKEYYDKLLHVSCTFTMLMFLTRFCSIPMSVGIMLGLQVIKTANNRRLDTRYKPYGDWAANSMGYVVYCAYMLIPILKGWIK